MASSSNIQNSTIQNCNNTHTTNNIQLISFGKESFDHLLKDKKDMLTKCFLNLPNGMVKALTEMYCNDDYPEYKNVKITNKKNKLAQVWDKDKWVDKPRKSTLEEMVNTGKNLLDEHVYNHEHEIKHDYSRLFDTSLNNLHKIKDALIFENSPHGKMLKKVITELETQIINITRWSIPSCSW